jgi:hypothetical protein
MGMISLRGFSKIGYRIRKVGWIHCAQWKVAVNCEYGNETLGKVKLLEYLSIQIRMVATP